MNNSTILTICQNYDDFISKNHDILYNLFKVYILESFERITFSDFCMFAYIHPY